MIAVGRRCHRDRARPRALKPLEVSSAAPAITVLRQRTDQSGGGRKLMPKVETSTPPNTPIPIGPYSHIARAGTLITIGATAGVDPATGQLAGSDIGSQARQILDSFAVMLTSVGSDLDHVVHVNVFLKHMSDFDAMNVAYVEKLGDHRPARTVIGVSELPKPGVLVTMGLTAVTSD
jgi:2-iminobutanoate/2-iminopropanoate deaminase